MSQKIFLKSVTPIQNIWKSPAQGKNSLIEPIPFYQGFAIQNCPPSILVVLSRVKSTVYPRVSFIARRRKDSHAFPKGMYNVK